MILRLTAPEAAWLLRAVESTVQQVLAPYQRTAQNPQGLPVPPRDQATVKQLTDTFLKPIVEYLDSLPRGMV